MENKTPPISNLRFTVDEPCTLLEYIIRVQPRKSRTKVKSQLGNRQVRVNGVITTQFDTSIEPGDIVEITSNRGPAVFKHPLMRIVFEDEQIVVIDKREGLLSVGTDKERTRTAFYILSEHVKKENPSARIFVVHRLDRETSGLMVYAKSEAIQSKMQHNWKNTIVNRKYVAVTEGIFKNTEGTIDAPLTESPALKVYVDKDGEKAITHYNVLETGKGYSLVELTLGTGKKNQIRAHLHYIGHPIAGDKKYGAVSNPASRVLLHAHILEFLHPVTGELLKFNTPIPQVFELVTKKGKTFVSTLKKRAPFKRG